MTTMTAAVARLAVIPVSASLTGIAFQIATAAAAALPGRCVGVVVAGYGQVFCVELSGAGPAAMLDERQYPAGYGPALVAALQGRTIVVDDTLREARFEDFRLLAARHGVLQVRAWPLAVPGAKDGAGSLTVYGSHVQALSDLESEHLDQFMLAASVLLTDAIHYAKAVVTVEQLQQAMRSRAVIEQAKGMIMADSGCTEEIAFERLKHMASTSERKVRDIALSLVQDVSRRNVPLPAAPPARLRRG